MTIEAGSELLHYRIVDKIGEGGMGAVYRAEDLRLDRQVAIKVLPEEVAGDEERLARFEREAKLLASLNHPHIGAIYGIEESDDTVFLVLELIAGEELDQTITRGPLPVAEVVAIGRQIAEALEAAHEQGIVHRDLKPANVKVTPAGEVKVLDFGLAKPVHPATSGPAPALSQSPTITQQMTRAGVLMGTAAYMSPEQARGQEVDRRADIWAFGVVLLEALTGKATFSGETASDVLASVLKEEPDLATLPPAVPERLRRLIGRCLDKDPRQRLRDIGEARIVLERLQRGEPETAVGQRQPSAPAARRGDRLWPVVAAASLLALAAVLLTGLPNRAGRAAAAGPKVTGMTQLTDLPGAQISPSLSADGSQLVYEADDGGDGDIFLLRVGGDNPINLTADYPDDDFQPAFSPDRQRIAFGSRREGGGIFVMGATGESPRQVSDAGFDPAWSPDGTRLLYTTERVVDPYARLGRAELWIVDVESRERRRLDVVDAVGATWSPGGRRIAFWTHVATVQGQRDLWTVPVDGGEPTAVMEDVHTDWDPIWSPDGRWLYFLSDRGGGPDLWRIAVDETSGRARGEPQPVTTGIARMMEASISADGRRIALTAQRVPGEIAVVDFDPVAGRPEGERSTVIASANPFHQVDVSPDSERVVYRTGTPREALYVVRLDGGGRRKLLDDEHRNRGPRWSPDGRWIAFYSNRSGSYEIWAMRANGTDLRQLTEEPDVQWTNPLFLRSGAELLLSASGSAGLGAAGLALGPDGIDGVTAPLTPQALPAQAGFIPGRVSPDDRLVAGDAIDPQGEQTAAVYSFETGSLELLARPDGQLLRSWDMGSAAWLDAHRLLLWELESQQAVLWDARTRQVRTVPGIAGPAELAFLDGARKLVLNRSSNESDIWLLNLEP